MYATTSESWCALIAAGPNAGMRPGPVRTASAIWLVDAWCVLGAARAVSQRVDSRARGIATPVADLRGRTGLAARFGPALGVAVEPGLDPFPAALREPDTRGEQRRAHAFAVVTVPDADEMVRGIAAR